MYPNLYYLFEDLFGIKIEFLKIAQSFGVMVAVSFLLAAYFFSKELRRKEAQGLIGTTSKKVLKGEKLKPADLAFSVIFGFIIFYKFVMLVTDFSSISDDTIGFLFSLKGSFWGGVAGGALLGYLKYREVKKEELPKPELVNVTVHPFEHVPNMTLIAAVAGIVGAKIFHNLEYPAEFFKDPIGSLVSGSGLTMYGGLILASFSVIYYARKNGITTTHLIDACAPSLMLAYGTGRIGCHISGDGDWGIPNLSEKPSWFILPDWAWAYSYPHNVNNAGDAIPGCVGKYCSELVPPVFPTPFYEAVVCISLFIVLWTFRKKFTIPGTLFSTYLILNGVERFCIEKIRDNAKVFGMNITQAEIIALVLILLGTAGILYFRRLKQKNAAV